MKNAVIKALSLTLGPLVRLMIAKDVRHPEISDHLKRLFVEEASAHFAIDGKRVTDSRISILTGLQRRDVKRLRDMPREATPVSMGPVARAILLWTTGPDWQDPNARPKVLNRRGDGDTSFETLVARISKDIHPRTLLDAMLTEGVVELDPLGDKVTLKDDAYLPKTGDAQLDYLGANLGDHAKAAIGNISAPAGAAPFFERAAHFNQLSEDSTQELDRLARRLQTEALQKIAMQAVRLQERDTDNPSATYRFRCGAYIYHDTPAARAASEDRTP